MDETEKPIKLSTTNAIRKTWYVKKPFVHQHTECHIMAWPSDLWAALVETARMAGVSKASIVREAVTEYLERLGAITQTVESEVGAEDTRSPAERRSDEMRAAKRVTDRRYRERKARKRAAGGM